MLALVNQQLPAHHQLENVDPECKLDYVANHAIPHSFDVALSNSFGFGGINATLYATLDGVIGSAANPDLDLKANAQPTLNSTKIAHHPKTAM